jgi:hypothetical protein
MLSKMYLLKQDAKSNFTFCLQQLVNEVRFFYFVLKINTIILLSSLFGFYLQINFVRQLIYGVQDGRKIVKLLG